MYGRRSQGPTTDIDPDQVRSVIKEYPVRCAFLFGSHAHGTATTSSDIDVAVAFEEGLSAAERLEQRIELTTALSKALGIDAIDVTDLDQVRPEVGRSVLETGIVLVGDDRMRRFDDVLERLEGRV